MEERAVSFNLHSSHGFAGRKAQATDEGNPLETSTDTDDDFEFIHTSGDHNEGQIRPVFPLFNRDLLTRNGPDERDGKKLPELALRLPLYKSFAFESDDKERDPPSSPSSESEADEFRIVPADAYYCSRKPEAIENLPRTYRKSDSAGALAAKQWKLSDFLYRRSSSEGTKDHSFVIYSPEDRGLEAEMKETIANQKAGKTNATKASLVSAHQMFYARKKQGEKKKKKKSYVPYRQDHAGFFANVNAYGKAFSFFQRIHNIGGHPPLPPPKPCP